MKNPQLEALKKEAFRKLAEQEAVTVIKGKEGSEAHFALYEMELDGVKLLLSGAESLIPLQISLLKAVDDLIKARLRIWNSQDFRRWADDFEEGFIQSVSEIKGEFSEWQRMRMPWGKPYNNRPKIQDISTPGFPYQTIIFYPDRSILDFLFFPGSYSEVAQQIVNWWNQRSDGSSIASGKGGNLPILKGQPLIQLYFEEDRDQVKTGNRPQKAEISFRILDKSANPKSPLPKITKADLQVIATNIQKQFGEGQRYVWKKGKETVSYRNRFQGFEGWYFVKSKQDGIDLISRLLAIRGLQIDRTCIYHSTNDAPDLAYPSNPPPILLLGESTDVASPRPLADVRFARAKAVLLKGQRPIELVRGSVVVYK